MGRVSGQKQHAYNNQVIAAIAYNRKENRQKDQKHWEKTLPTNLRHGTASQY